MVEEFKRWIEAGRPDLWYRHDLVIEKWSKTDSPRWYKENIYIVDDEQAALRMLQADKPETEFECFITGINDWRETEPEWSLYNEYRAKVEELVLYIEYLDTKNNNIIVQPNSMTITSDYYETGRTFELPK